jgi:pyruvate dehydrogenase E2 component (dihydrolipoamide acetyltransferase)
VDAPEDGVLPIYLTDKRKESFMEKEIVLPELGEDAGEEAEVSFWYVQEGEEVEEGADLVEMVTDKAAFTVPSPETGILKEIVVSEGDNVSAGQKIAVIDV